MCTFTGRVAEVNPIPGPSPFKGKGDCVAGGKGLVGMNEERVSKKAREGLIERARQMRKEPTSAEALLWTRLRKKQLDGLKFRRQHIIHYFIVDFYCPTAKLAIEIDGPVHDEQEEYDEERDKILQELGYQVVRFKNADVERNLDEVVTRIYDLCRRRIDLITD